MRFRNNMRLDESKLKPGTEYDEVMKYLAWIKRDCKPFLHKASKAPIKNRLVFRGWDGNLDIGIKRVRKDRRPLDTNEVQHKALNMIFKEMFGWKPRSEGLFVNPTWGRALGYGDTTGVVFPVSKFRFIWSPIVKDLYVHASRQTFNRTMTFKEYVDGGYYDELKKKIAGYNYTDKNFEKALQSYSEIMIECNHYYAIEDEVLTEAMGGGPIDQEVNHFSEWIWSKLHEI